MRGAGGLRPRVPLVMSYRSIKRVLGETSLERKCRLLFGACLLVLITGSFWWYGSQTQELVSEPNRVMGRLLADQGLINLHFMKWEPLEKGTDAPGPGPQTVGPQKDKEELVSYLIARLENQDYDWRAIIPKRPNQELLLTEENHPRNDFERALLAEYEAAPPPETNSPSGEGFRQWTTPDGNWYHYYQPVRAQAMCLNPCHTPLQLGGSLRTPSPAFGRSSANQPGDLLAVIHVTIPTQTARRAMAQNRAILITAAIITVALAMVAAYVIVRYVIVKPLKHLRDVSDAISHGNTSLRAEIHTGDEFEDLAVAFNRMLRHLTSTQDELRHVNADLDAKVDELAQANMQLYETNRIKSDFLATMSHELRTPLNSILGFSEVLGSIDALDEKQKRYVANIQKSGRTLLEMINNILDLAKIESGRAEVRLSEFPVEQVVGAQCDMARPLAEKKNIDLETEIQPGVPPLRQDQARVQQILNNLLSNAIKFTPEGGRITVSARRGEQDELVLRVCDTGVGIAEEDLGTIFQKFRQGGNALADGDAMTREYSGTGLGLSIVQELCKLLGGDVSAESRLGKGSTVPVRLPWTLTDQPRRDWPISDELDHFGRLRPEPIHGAGRA